MKTRWFLYIVLIVTVTGLLALSCVNICPLLVAILPSIPLTGPALAEFVISLGGWGVAGSISLMIMHSFIPFPAEILTMANGMVYGPFRGIVITWIGAMLGAYASFGLTRIFGRPLVE